MIFKEAIQRVFFRCSSSQASELVPVVKIPVYVNKYLTKARKKDQTKLLLLKQRTIYRGDTQYPVISCTDKEKTFYLGQIYNKNYPVPLQSQYWFKTKASGQKFCIHPWDTNPSLPVLENKLHDTDIYSAKLFSELIENENVLKELRNMGFKSPTPIQVLAVPEIVSRKHLLLAAETGCGKTVAYLAPIIQNIISVKRIVKHFPNTPLALILAPGRELAEQIANVAYQLCRGSGVDVRALVVNGTSHEHLKLTENASVDILVATVGTLLNLVRHNIFKLTNLHHLVLDEADTLLDDSFIEDTRNLLKRVPFYKTSLENLPEPYGTQLILTSSVYPSTADSVLMELFEEEVENVVKIKSPYLHRVVPHVKQRFWRVDNDNRAGIVLDLVKSDSQKNKPVMVFCTHSPTCDWMGHFLKENGVQNVVFHAGMSSDRRESALKNFQNGLSNVIICTDIASRGIDTQHVKHVINFDFPTSVSDYILRAGRVGRVGSNQGYVTNLVVSVAGSYAVQTIERAVRSSKRIQDVDSNIRRKISKLFYAV